MSSKDSGTVAILVVFNSSVVWILVVRGGKSYIEIRLILGASHVLQSHNIHRQTDTVVCTKDSGTVVILIVNIIV